MRCLLLVKRRQKTQVNPSPEIYWSMRRLILYLNPGPWNIVRDVQVEGNYVGAIYTGSIGNFHGVYGVFGSAVQPCRAVSLIVHCRILGGETGN